MQLSYDGEKKDIELKVAAFPVFGDFSAYDA